ncbi:unnamed protein product [Ectocarpus sp. 4 AP-2014]
MAMTVARSMWWRPAKWEQSPLRPISTTIDSETQLAATPTGARQHSPGMATCPRIPGGRVLPSSAASAASLTTLGPSTASTSFNLASTYQGDTRVRTVDVAVYGDLVTTWTSSGTTSGFESIDTSGATGQVVTVTGTGLCDSEWPSIVETEIMVYNGVAPPPSPTTSATPSPTLPPTTADLNACFDSTSDDYRCLQSEDNPNTILNNCNFVDADGADIPACLETFRKADIQFVYMPFHDDLTTLPVGVFSGLDNILDMDISYTGL